MIAKIKGEVSYIGPKFIIVDVGGVGYKIFVSNSSMEKIARTQSVEFFTYLSVRENALDLYGFETIDEQNVFEMLLDVSGIGPKSALGILNVATIESLVSAIKNGDLPYLTKVSGIGRKTAEKIILELKDKIIFSGYSGEDGTNGDSDTLDALLALGYKDNQIREALKQIPQEVKNVNERIREALKYLGK